MGTQTATVFIRDDDGMSPVVMHEKAKAVIEAIDAETGNRQAHSDRVKQLCAVGIQINRARSMGARFHTAHRIVQFFFEVFVANYGFGKSVAAV